MQGRCKRVTSRPLIHPSSQSPDHALLLLSLLPFAVACHEWQMGFDASRFTDLPLFLEEELTCTICYCILSKVGDGRSDCCSQADASDRRS